MVFHGRVNDSPKLNAGLVALWFVRGSGPVLQRNPITLWFFRMGPDPLPPSWSAHAGGHKKYMEFIGGLVVDAWLWLGPFLPHFRVTLALTVSEWRDFWLVSSKYVNMIRLILCDDALHKLGKVSKKYQERIQSSTTPDPGHCMGKWLKHKKTSHTREPRG